MSALEDTSGNGTPRVSRRALWLHMVLLMVVAGVYGVGNAWVEQATRTYPLDLDGWGHLVTRLKHGGNQFADLFRDPSLWKGVVVPFVFGSCYYIAPFDESVLVFNGLAFALAVGCLFYGFCMLGVSRFTATGAVLLWLVYLPHRLIFAYYFAEPFLALLSAVTFVLLARTLMTRSLPCALATGATSGLLLLSRAPYLLVVASVPLFLWSYLGEKRRQAVLLFALGFGVVFSPWPVRNYLVYQQFIPFTTEGGKILCQGTYLPGDDALWNNLLLIPEFRAMQQKEVGLSPLEQERYWRGLALEQIRRDPLGQLRLIVRKVIRFWVYLPEHSWIPAWKTAFVAALTLPLAALAVIRQRRRLLVQLAAVWVGGLWAFHALIHAELRYNFPVLPMLFVLALVGARQLVPAARRETSASVRVQEAEREPTLSPG
jgi:hypothetical protein